MGAFPLLGIDRSSWNEEHEKDLVALKARERHDPFSGWFTESFIPAFHHIVGSKFKVYYEPFSRCNVAHISKRPVSEHLGSGLFEYDETAMQMIARVLTTVVASILPLCSVIILYVVQSNGLRLGIIVILSAIFSLALALMTNARKIEIFAATSA
jgi:hypothetical protein